MSIYKTIKEFHCKSTIGPNSKNEVLFAVQNISMLEKKSVHIVRSEERRIV